ncbi:YIP1 family protein [Cohnella silvisoli]|uniref:YIP1 family protein n=1 Tax=Cohnella silvisoli TaxID=2873699 RepID=A0ABV1L3G7_9BACL|nr:YIP1 family protein [Cohnella silvisoli]MCD9026177.1 YIP1 family protein [Cohnella silvisoli]
MIKRLFPLFFVFGLLLSLTPSPVSAKLPYITAYMDSNSGNWNTSQAVYVPGKTITLSLEEPVDLFIDDKDIAYVVDRKTNRIVIVDPDGNELRSIGDTDGAGALNAPEGVFVDKEGIVYVADTGNQRIAVYSSNGTFKREYKKPDSPYLAKDAFFVPSKLVVDKRGVMYIILSGSDQGLMRLDPDGVFTGAFGANKAEQSYSNWLKKLILNKEQLAKEIANRPRPIANVTIDEDGFFFTASPGSYSGSIRKLNAGGYDSFRGRGFWNTIGIIDVAVDQNGFIYDIDSDSASVTLFDPYGDALFAFGDIDSDSQQQGLFGFPTSIAVNSKHSIWVTDSKLKNIQTFERTSFGEHVLTATMLYMNGQYTESKPYWQKVHEQNDMYNLTFQGLGRIDFEEKRYSQSLENFKIAYDVEGYSRAFWEIRFAWLQRNLIYLILALTAAYLAVKYGYRLLRRLTAKHSWPPLLIRYRDDLKDFRHVLLHPYSGFYKLKGRTSSWAIIVFILLLAVGIKLLHIYFTGFVFNPVDNSQINLFNKLAFFVIPWLTWIIANYLVCSVKGGEGRLREVIQASTYALAPYIIFSLPIIVLSNIVVLEERVIVDLWNQAMLIWLLVLLFVSTQVVHNFDFLETIRNSLISLFAIIIIWFFAFIVSGLTFNLYDFIRQLYREVIFYG